eukprot:TRINITY_DN2205_c0_g1_i2.p1 TRINITY_DN2205_c0_g1~~TRINITY_DN2205_c0_g1_i2.p1  ORF type:complete len:631 (+),score=93.73 TRINITY_DN2205_c0_g1_i2:103-1893(+)
MDAYMLRQRRFKEDKAIQSLSAIEKKPSSELLCDEERRWMYLPNCGASFAAVMPNSVVEEIFLRSAPAGFVGAHRIKSKPYALIEYEDAASAAAARRELHGTHSDLIKKWIFLFFAKWLPAPFDVAAAFDSTSSGRIPSTPDTDVAPEPCATGPLPKGLFIVPNFISVDEEKQILQEVDNIDQQEWTNLNRRSVAHFGYEFSYKTRNVVRDRGAVVSAEFPDWVARVSKRVEENGNVGPRIDQLTINNYRPGDGIPHHIDTHSAFEGPIVSLSLLSNTIMEFRHPEGERVDVFVPRRSLLIMSSDARLLWSHGITPRKTDQLPTGGLNVRGRRVSLTFRKVRPADSPCDCVFWAQCDRRKEEVSSASENRVVATPIVEKLFVHDMYNAIGNHFSSTRHSPWPAVAQFINALPAGTLLADIGCGNGRYLGLNSSIFKLGSDRSEALTKICAEKSFEAMTADALKLPLRSNAFDVVMCIAVIHHLSTLERRVECVRELIRVLREGGVALIYVWALDQPDRTFGQPDLFVPWHLPKEPKIGKKDSDLSAEDVEHQAVADPSSGSDEGKYRVLRRFYHVFRVRYILSAPTLEVKTKQQAN